LGGYLTRPTDHADLQRHRAAGRTRGVLFRPDDDLVVSKREVVDGLKTAVQRVALGAVGRGGPPGGVEPVMGLGLGFRVGPPGEVEPVSRKKRGGF